MDKKLFGGIAFMIAGQLGVVNETLLARVAPEHWAEAVGQTHACEPDFTGKA